MYQRRRDLLPFWMKFFIWMFLILAAMSAAIYTVYMLTGVFYGYSGASVYGMEAAEIASPLGIFITAILLFKVFTAFSMWMEKKWALDLGIADAAAGIILSVYMMFVEPLAHVEKGHIDFNLRFELIFLIPYLLKCIKINRTWKNMRDYVPDPNAPKNKRVKFSHDKSFNYSQDVQPEILPAEKVNPYIPKDNLNKEDDEDYLKRYMPK